MDYIRLKNMKFFAYHGLFKEEEKLGQRFEVDLELALSLEKAGRTDHMQDSVHYGEVYDVVKNVIENRRYHLLESLAQNIASEVLDKDIRISEVAVVVRKPAVPIAGILDCAEVEIRRTRNG